MTQQLTEFKFEEMDIVVNGIMVEGEPYLIGNEVAQILGYSNYRNTVSTKVDEEDKLRTGIEYAGQKRDVTLINESGLYSLILSSKLDGAKKFKRWVTSEVLPSLRKHGGYLTESKLEEVLLNPDTIIQLATNLKNEQEARKLTEQQKKEAELLAQQKEEVILEQKPKVDFVDEYVASVGLQKMGEVAKIFGIGRNSLYKMLRDANVLMGDNKPYQYYMNLGWFEVKTVTKDWKVMSVTLVTSKGIYGIAKKLNLLG